MHAVGRLDIVRIIDRNVKKKDVKGLTVDQYALRLITPELSTCSAGTGSIDGSTTASSSSLFHPSIPSPARTSSTR